MNNIKVRVSKAFDTSIAIIHTGPIEPLKKCIASIKQNTAIPYQLVIVVDKPDNAMKEYLASLDAKVTTNPELTGIEHARNQASQMADGKYICAISSDIELSPTAVESMRQALIEKPEFGWVALSSEHTGFFTGCSMLTREAFSKVGLLDKEFPGAFSDDDYIRRMWKAGYDPHIVVGVKVSHKTEIKAISTEEKAKKFKIAQELFYKKYGETGTNWDAFPKYQPKKSEPTIDIHRRLDASYYNEDYFRPGPKSGYNKPFTWEVEGKNRLRTAQLLKDSFSPENALDVGCAKGFLCKALLETRIDAYGCDISEFAVNNCEPEVSGRLKVVDIRDSLPYPDNSFDLVCSYSTLEHIEMEFLPYVASEMARVARKWVLINVPVAAGSENKPWGDPSHRTYMPASYWTSLFCKQGLTYDQRTSHHDKEPYLNINAIFSKEGAMVKKLALNVGSFTVMLPPPWINLDIIDLSAYAREHNFNFQQVDVTKGLPFKDNSIDFINASHLIEHLTVDEGIAFLKEARRVLKPSCTARIGTPDVKILITAYDEKAMDRFNNIQPDEYKQAPSQADKFWRILTAGHKTCYDLPALQHSLELAGFKGTQQSEYNKELDMFPEVSLYVEAKKPVAEKIPAPQLENIPEYWNRFPTKIKEIIPNEWENTVFNNQWGAERFKQLVDEFNIKTVVETGTHLANSTVLLAGFVDRVYTIEINEEYVEQAKARLLREGYTQTEAREYVFSYINGEKQITLFWGNSPSVIEEIIEHLEEPICFILDAHWKEYWPVKDEIQAIKPRPNSIIIIHDIKVPDKPFGYEMYRSVTLSLKPKKKIDTWVSLDYDLVKDDLAYVNPNYKICYNDEAPTKPTSRGILYALPEKPVPEYWKRFATEKRV